MAQWQKQNTSCPNCKRAHFDRVKAPKLLQKMLDNTVFNCQYQEDGCNGVFSYKDREQHYKDECIIAMKTANECPFGCGEQIPFSFSVHDHVMTTCTSKDLRCETCNINVYKEYAESTTLFENFEGHNCLKDLKKENEILKQSSNDELVAKN